LGAIFRLMGEGDAPGQPCLPARQDNATNVQQPDVVVILLVLSTHLRSIVILKT
jgi:hypothetical protein